MIRNVTLEEMGEAFKQLEEQGWKPQWCSKPVPQFDSIEKAEKYLESVKGGAKSAPAGEEPTDKA